MRLHKALYLLVLFIISFNITAQNGNKDYSDTPVTNNGANIIFIYLDDLGYGDLGKFWQNEKLGAKRFATPNIDKIADEGAMLTHHYAAAPVCAPARSSLLEGLHQGHSSVRDNQFDVAIKEGLTMAEMLRKAGYRTMHVGKAGVAGPRNLQKDPFKDPQMLEAHPLKRGFDQFYGYLYHNQGHVHYPENGTTVKKSYFTDGYDIILKGTEKTYTTDVFTAKTKQWIATHERTRPDQPFFLYLAYDVPHSSLDVPTQAYPKGKGLKGGLQWTCETSATPWVNTASGTKDSFIHPDYASTNWTETEKRHATMIRRVDNAVDDIIATLKDLNIDDKTLIVFSSDNGPHNENSGGDYRQDPQSFESYANFNGIKRDLWEGGIRMPTLCRFPGVIPAHSTVTFPSGQWDWMATFSEVAQVVVPAYTDGVSLMPALMQNNSAQIDKGYTYHEYSVNGSTPSYSDFETSKQGRKRGQMQVIRMGDYKGVRYDIKDHSTSPFEIYNVVTDERESENLAASMPLLQQQMLDKVLQIRKKGSVSRPYDSELIPSSTVTASVNGLHKSVLSGKHDWVPNFKYITPKNTSEVSEINMDANGLASEFGLFYTGFINIPQDGAYTFYLESAAKSHVMLHDIHLLDNDYNHTTGELSEQVYLKSGLHPIRISYQQNDEVTPALSLKLKGPGITKAAIPNSMFFVENTLKDEDFELKLGVQLFPNPFNDDLEVVVNASQARSSKIGVYSITGQQVYTSHNENEVKSKNKHLRLPLSNIKSGLYFVKVEFDTNEIITKKLLKK